MGIPRRIPVLFMVAMCLAGPAAAALPEDPYRSPMWAYNIERYLGEAARVRHSDRVNLKVPGFAEDSAQVPLTLDLTAFEAEIREIVTWVDLNPVPHLFSYAPGEARPRVLALNFRVQQATTVRAAVLDGAGTWHLGSARVDAAGGGCTAPSVTSANPDWAAQFGRMRGGVFPRPAATRIKLNIMHPMDSGMVGNIPVFHIESVELRRPGSDAPLGRMRLSESAAENPMFVFDIEGEGESLSLWLRDNQGNEFEYGMTL